MRLATLAISGLLLLAAIVTAADDDNASIKRSRSFRPRIKTSSSSNAAENPEPEASSSGDQTRRQPPVRTRNRVPRPPIITPPPLVRALDDADDEETSFTLSRGAGIGGPVRQQDDDDDADDSSVETPRFIPSRGGSGNLSPSKDSTRSSTPSSSTPSRSPLAPKLSAPNSDGYKVVCYYTNWSQYRQKIGKFLPENIDPHLCTHIIFAFGWIKNGKLTSFEANDVSNSPDGKAGMTL